MEIKEAKTVDMLTKESVSILTQRVLIEDDGNSSQVGDNHRISYVNSESGRDQLVSEQPEEVCVAVFAMWGDTPTVEDPERRDPNDILVSPLALEEVSDGEDKSEGNI